MLKEYLADQIDSIVNRHGLRQAAKARTRLRSVQEGAGVVEIEAKSIARFFNQAFAWIMKPGIEQQEASPFQKENGKWGIEFKAPKKKRGK